MKYVYFDFEFNSANKQYLNLICGADAEGKTWDLRHEEGRDELKRYVLALWEEEFTLVAYSLESELRSFFSLFRCDKLSDLPFTHYICLHTEHKFWANKNKKYLYGDVIMRGNITKRKYFGRPLKKDEKESGEDNRTHNLLNALWKWCNSWDEKHARYKDIFRDICIRGDDLEVAQNISEILKYCRMDTMSLPTLHKAMLRSAKEIELEDYATEQFERGYYTAICAEKAQRGYVIDALGYYNIVAKYPSLISVVCEHINKTFSPETFAFDHKLNRYVFKRNIVQDFVTKAPPHIKSAFTKTKKTGELSISKDNLEKLYGGVKHSLDPQDYLQQIYKYLITISSLRGVVATTQSKESAKPFSHYFDPEKQTVHPSLRPYGSLTGRSQPAANSYLLAKPAWMRLLLVPPEDHVMIWADYSKQEPLYLGCMSQDTNLLSDYFSSDLYESYGRRAKLIGPEKASETLCHALKTAFLATMYGMSEYSLSVSLSTIFKRRVTPMKAQKFIQGVAKAYPVAHRWKKKTLYRYSKDHKIVLDDGWTMWGQNPNPLSVMNFPIQGGCGVIMRNTDKLAYRGNLYIPMTLHDGFYAYAPLEKAWDATRFLIQCMHEGFAQGVNYARGANLLKIKVEIVSKKFLQMHKPQNNIFLTVQHRSEKKAYAVKLCEDLRDPRATEDLKTFEPIMHPKIQGEQNGNY